MTRTHDVVVLGGGLLGCAVARELAIRGADVLVVEEHSEDGAEPNGLGVLAPDLTDGELSRTGLALYPEWTETLEAVSGIDVGFSRCLGARVAFDRVEADRLHALGDGADGSWETNQPEFADHATAQRPFADVGHVDLADLSRALTDAAERAGVAFTNDTVKEVSGQLQPIVIGVESRYAAAHVIGARPGPWRLLSSRFEDVRIPELEIADETSEGSSVVLASERARLVSNGDGRVGVYGTPTPSPRRTAITLQEVRTLMDAAMELMPTLKEAGLRRFRCVLGVRSPEGGDIVGPLGPGRWGFGTDPRVMGLLAPGGAQRLADLIEAS